MAASGGTGSETAGAAHATHGLGRHLQAFLEMLVAERNAAANTVEAYRRDLENFTGFLARRQTRPETADGEAIRAYLAQMSGSGMAPRTMARHMSAIRQDRKSGV